MSLTEDFNRRLDFAKREMEEAGLDTDSPFHDALQRVGIPVPPLLYSSFLLNFMLIVVFWIVVMGTFLIIYALVVSRSLEVLIAASTVLTSLELWVGAVILGMAGSAIAVYRRRKYELTKWNAI